MPRNIFRNVATMRSITARLVVMIVLVGAAATAEANDLNRAPQGVPEGIEKPLRISPGPANARNSEGDFIQLKDGRLMLIYTKFVGSKSHDHATADLMARYSSDEGRSWTAEDEPVLERQAGESNLMSVSLLRLQDDRIALFYVMKYTSPKGARYSYFDSILMRTSDDEGQTWSDATHVSPVDNPGYRVLNNDRVIQLKTGRLVVPVATHYLPGWKGWRDSAEISCYLSDDGGTTWRNSTSTLSTDLLAQEPGVVELTDDRVMLFCRSRDCQLTSYSDDGGSTWSPLQRSNMPQPTTSPASIERIPSTGDLLLVWNNGDDPHAKLKPVGRRPFSAAVSSDDGKTWRNIRNIGTDPDGWYCYTAIEFVGEHILLAHCEYPRLNSQQVTRFPVRWLYQPVADAN